MAKDDEVGAGCGASSSISYECRERTTYAYVRVLWDVFVFSADRASYRGSY